MALNIKNDEAHRLAREVSELTGDSMTGAVTEALRERRDRLRGEERDGSLSARLLEIGGDIAERLPPELREGDPTDFLYGDDGLPR